MTNPMFKLKMMGFLIMVFAVLSSSCIMDRAKVEETKSIKNLNEVNSCVKGKECDSALIEAVKVGDLYKIKSLIKAGADANTKEGDNDNPVLFLGSIECVKELIIAGANVNATNRNGTTALMWASHFGEYELSLLLINSGANVNWKNLSGTTPLMDAAVGGNPLIVKLLLEKGALINAVSEYGNTALKIAKSRSTDDPKRIDDYKKIIEILKNSGAIE